VGIGNRRQHSFRILNGSLIDATNTLEQELVGELEMDPENDITDCGSIRK
jgi:hypothetical protein